MPPPIGRAAGHDVVDVVEVSEAHDAYGLTSVQVEAALAPGPARGRGCGRDERDGNADAAGDPGEPEQFGAAVPLVEHLLRLVADARQPARHGPPRSSPPPRPNWPRWRERPARFQPVSSRTAPQRSGTSPAACPRRARAAQRPVPVVTERAEGAWIIDADGNRFIDYALGYGPLILGHSPRAVLDAIRADLDRGLRTAAVHRGEAELAGLIAECVPSAELTAFVSTGSEAVQLGAAHRARRNRPGAGREIPGQLSWLVRQRERRRRTRPRRPGHASARTRMRRTG